MKSKITQPCFTMNLMTAIALQLTLFYSAHAQTEDSVVFNSSAKEQTWTVPKGVTSIHVDANGAQGGSAKGGKGGEVLADVAVTPGTKLIIYVGSQPDGTTGGANGGGNGCGNGYGGGGASDIRIGGQGLEARVLVAGGGGGGGYGGFGGAGGGLTGGDGKYTNDNANPDHDAKGGTQQAGGNGARAYFSKAGTLGTGGDGINSRGECSNGAMGGGGGGYYGGGGSAGGGGGGGSSFTNSSCTNVSHQQGAHEGNGKIVIYWEKPKN
jgi:hypothetical protein